MKGNEKIKNFFKDMFSDSNSVSLTRILTFLVVTDIMTVWTIECIKNFKMQDIPWGPVSVIGLMITGKVVQKFAEPKNNGCNGNKEEVAPKFVKPTAEDFKEDKKK